MKTLKWYGFHRLPKWTLMIYANSFFRKGNFTLLFMEKAWLITMPRRPAVRVTYFLAIGRRSLNYKLWEPSTHYSIDPLSLTMITELHRVTQDSWPAYCADLEAVAKGWQALLSTAPCSSSPSPEKIIKWRWIVNRLELKTGSRSQIGLLGMSYGTLSLPVSVCPTWTCFCLSLGLSERVPLSVK